MAQWSVKGGKLVVKACCTQLWQYDKDSIYGLYDPSGDDKGIVASRSAHHCFNEGIYGLSDRPRQVYLWWMRAAELFCLHGAALGNGESWWRLGIIYLLDLLYGSYWEGPWPTGGPMPDSLGERSFICFNNAVSSGYDIALRWLADARFEGYGCERDYGIAYSLYARSYAFLEHRCRNSVASGHLPLDCAVRELGLSELGLALCHEGGRGCKRSSEQALLWFERAFSDLGGGGERAYRAYADPEGWRPDAALEAKAGIARVRQELDLQFASECRTEEGE